MADLYRRGSRAPTLFWVKKEEMTEGRKAGWASKLKPGPLLSSKSGSATAMYEKFRFLALARNTIMLRNLIISFALHYLSSGSLTEGYKTKENFKIVAQKVGEVVSYKRVFAIVTHE